MFKIDPLTENGSIDVEFFASDDYSKHRRMVESYLMNEGFLYIKDPIVLQIYGRYWSICPVYLKR